MHKDVGSGSQYEALWMWVNNRRSLGNSSKARKALVDILYRYNSNLYRYNLLEKWQWTYCTGTTQTCTGTTCLKINSGEIVPVQLKHVPVQLHGNCGICLRTRSVREGTLVNEPKWENHIGGGYKSKRTQVIGSF